MASFNEVYIAVGSNIGDREHWIQKAVHYLEQHNFIQVMKTSKLVDTVSDTPFPQPNYLNGVIKIQTILSPQELLVELQQIEKKCGRTSKGDLAPRTIDLDILFYDDTIISDENLTVPHPLLHERLFVLEPLMEIDPEKVHPILGEPIKELYEKQKGY